METPLFPDFSSDELPQDRALRLGAQRLQGAVSQLPLRYAPFYAQLAALWEVQESHVVQELTRAREPGSWQKTLVSGLRTFEVQLLAPSEGAHAHLLHLEPRLTFPMHRHRGPERVLVLEGSYADDSGHQVSAGEEQTMLPGSEHRLHILGDVPCVAAVSERGVSYIAPWLAKLLRFGRCGLPSRSPPAETSVAAQGLTFRPAR